jgi:cephalosporin-C deacetylase
MVYLGLADDVCPPETGLAVYEALGTPERRLHTYPGRGHLAGLPGVTAEIEAFLAGHLTPEVAR